MVLWLRQSTAVTVMIGPFVDSTDGNTEETGAIAANEVLLSKNGASWAAKNEGTAPTHNNGGCYTCPLNTTDTGTLGILKVKCHPTGMLYFHEAYMVVTQQVWDSFCASDLLQVDVREKGAAALDFTTTEKASINTQVDDALNTAIPGTPTADSVNERVKAIDDKLPTNYIMGSTVLTSKDDEIDSIKNQTDLIPADIILQLDTNLPAIKAKTDALPTDPADQSELVAEINANETKIDAVSTAVAALQTDVTKVLKIGKNKLAIVGTTMTLYNDDGVTPLFTWTLDSGDAPTVRTPA